MKKIIILIAVILILSIIVILFAFQKDILKITYPKKYTEAVEKYAKEHEVEEELIYALIKNESNFKNDAKSHKSAMGLMQIIPETSIDVANKNKIELDKNNLENELYNAEKNINIGTKYLAELIKRYKNYPVAISAYNAGIGTVDNWIEKGIIQKDGKDIEKVPYKETNNYVRKVLRDYNNYKEIYNKN